MNTIHSIRRGIARLTTLRAPYAESVEQQLARRVLFMNLAWMLLALAALPVLIWWAIDDRTIDAITLFFPIIPVIGFVTHRLIQHGQLQWARGLFVANILVVSILSIFPSYRIDTAFIIVLTLPLTAAGVLLPRSGLFTVAAVLVLIVFVGGLIQIDIDMAPTPFGSTLESIRTTILVVVGIVALNVAMLWAFGSSMEDTLRQQRQVAALIEAATEISRTLVDLPTNAEALDRTVEQLRDLLGLYHVQVFLADPASGLPVLRASTGFIGRRLLEEDSLLSPGEDSPVNDAMRQKGPILIPETAPDQQRSGFLPATRSELLLPLRVGNLLPLGVLDLHSAASDVFSEKVLEALAVISNHMAAALHSNQQTRELRTGYLERDQLIEQIETSQRELARMNRQLVGATWGTYLAERQGGTPSYDWREGATTPTTRDESALMKQALDDGKPHLEHRAGQDVLCVPIRLRGQTLGVLEFSRENMVRWSPAAVELAQAVAERLALSLENARLFEQAQTTAHREHLVSQITSQLQTTNDLETLLTLAAVQFQDALGATYTRIQLGSEAPGELK